MVHSLLINVDVGETRVALVQDGVLGELYVERKRDRSPVGNVYVGKVTRVLPGMQAAFIDVGLDRAAFLHVEDLLKPDDPEAPEEEDGKDAKGDGKSDGKNGVRHNRASRETPIRDLLREGQDVLVQVSKGPISTKGARVTAHVALPGRYVVYMPTVDSVGVSKRIGGDKERKRLKEVIDAIKPPTGGVVVRTLAQGLTKKQLKADVGYLVKVWESVQGKLQQNNQQRKKPKSPYLVHEEPDIVLRAARDMFTEDVNEIVVDDPKDFARLKEFLELFLPERANDVRLYEGDEPLFDEYGIEDEIARALSRKVSLPSGGYLIIDQAEALTAIDVNTGRFTGKGKDVEQTILQTNLEAVVEACYQLRFRNIGGLIVLDFIDMEKSANRDKVYKALLKELKKDKAKTTAVRISELGLVEMTRKRTHESLGRLLYEQCFYCDGTGHLKSKTTVCHEIFRQMRREKDSLPGYKITVSAHPAVCDALEREEKDSLEEASKRFQRRIELQPRTEYHLEQFDLTAGN
jgi:ribonuclease G